MGLVGDCRLSGKPVKRRQERPPIILQSHYLAGFTHCANGGCYEIQQLPVGCLVGGLQGAEQAVCS